jgi:transglutaminase-like putative cysteine protease
VTATFLEPEVAVGAVEQLIHYEYSKPVRNLRQRLVVVPPPRHGRQHRVEWTVDVRGAEAEVLRTGCDGFGNVRIEVVVPEVRSWIEFDVRTAIEFRDEWDPGLLADPRYLEPTRLTAADDAIALLLTGCDRSDPARICQQVHRALEYEYGITGVHTTAADALRGSRGVCQDYAHLMLAACRLVGLPARYVSGHLVGEGASHAWVEVLRPHDDDPNTWVAEAWDPTHCRRTDDSYITVATGCDYSDVAPMSGTFDGRARGKLTVTKRAHTWRAAHT